VSPARVRYVIRFRDSSTFDLARAEPKTLRDRLLHIAAASPTAARRLRLRLRIQRSWPCAHALTAAFHRLAALPVPHT